VVVVLLLTIYLLSSCPLIDGREARTRWLLFVIDLDTLIGLLLHQTGVGDCLKNQNWSDKEEKGKVCE